MYVYTKSERFLWTVGFYKPDGTWVAESDYSTRLEAAQRTHYLNGGNQLGEATPPSTFFKRPNHAASEATKES